MPCEAAQSDLETRELRHRFRNNLQMISALLRAQARKAKGGEAAHELNEAADRIAAFTEINASLEGPALINPRLLLTRLARGLHSALVGPRPIEIRVACHQCSERKRMVDARTGMALGIITNELVINAIKYAFPDEQPGRIEISLKPNGDILEVSIEDDGAGTSDESGSGLGLQLVHTVALQNGGTIERKTGKGVRWEVRLPLVKLEAAGQLRAAM